MAIVCSFSPLEPSNKAKVPKVVLTEPRVFLPKKLMTVTKFWKAGLMDPNPLRGFASGAAVVASLASADKAVAGAGAAIVCSFSPLEPNNKAKARKVVLNEPQVFLPKKLIAIAKFVNAGLMDPDRLRAFPADEWREVESFADIDWRVTLLRKSCTPYLTVKAMLRSFDLNDFRMRYLSFKQRNR